MRRSVRWIRRLAIVGGVLVTLGLVAWFWILPVVLSRVISAQTGSAVALGPIWFSRGGVVISGVTLHDGDSRLAPVWLHVRRISTDLTLGGLLHGRYLPTRVEVDRPTIRLRIAEDGRLLTSLGPNASPNTSNEGPISLPTVWAHDAEVTLAQAGRPPFTLSHVEVKVAGHPEPHAAEAVEVEAITDDAVWGKVEAHGRFDLADGSGQLKLKSLAAVNADPEALKSIPWMPPEVTQNVSPHGPVDVRCRIRFDPKANPAVLVSTDLDVRGATVRVAALDLATSSTHGVIHTVGGLVTIEHVHGRAADGEVKVEGSLDFNVAPPKFDLEVDLDAIDIDKTPKSWQLDETGATGRLSGHAHVIAVLRTKGIDLTGTSGRATIHKGMLRGVPIESLRLAMHAEGNDLQYNADTVETGKSVIATAKTNDLGGLKLPKSFSTRIRLRDVDLAKLARRAETLLGYKIPIPLAGRLSLTADATIPLESFRDARGYAFHGDLELKGASIARVDVSRFAARIDLAGGVLKLTNLRGRLVDRPDGDASRPPPAGPLFAADDVLPPRGFRGELSAQLAPPGKVTAKLVGGALPLGEIVAPAFDGPTPLVGELSLDTAFESRFKDLGNPAAWLLTGSADSRRLQFRTATLDAVTLRFGLREGLLEVSKLEAMLAGQPLIANGRLNLKAPQRFAATLDACGWDIARAAAWVPGAPADLPMRGRVTVRADANGAISPFSLITKGSGRFDGLTAEAAEIGEVPFVWNTERDEIVVSIPEARPLGGTIAGAARVPLTAGKPVVADFTLQQLDLTRAKTLLRGRGVGLSGRIDGKAHAEVPNDTTKMKIQASLVSDGVTARGVEFTKLDLKLNAGNGVARYSARGERNRARFEAVGTYPLDVPSEIAAARAELAAVRFQLVDVWRVIGLAAGFALEGEVAATANVRTALPDEGPNIWARGIVEMRGLRWARRIDIGGLRGELAMRPDRWRLDPVTGTMLGAPISGTAWGETPSGAPARLGCELRLDPIDLKRIAALSPGLANRFDGFGALRVNGSLDDEMRANVELTVPHARLEGLPLSDLRMPIEVVVSPDGGSGLARTSRWTARFAGGQLHGDGWMRLGLERPFHTAIHLADVDLQAITRLDPESTHPASGRVEGDVVLDGFNPTRVSQVHGRFDLDLTDASIVNIPVFREIDKFLGATRGGLFNNGKARGAIANRRVNLDSLWLRGRLVQLHASGTIGFDGRLGLEVLVNTPQLIALTGQALVAIIPGLRDVLSRREQAASRVEGYLSSRLIKLRVGGTLASPSVRLDPSIGVGDSALGFFANALDLPGDR